MKKIIGLFIIVLVVLISGCGGAEVKTEDAASARPTDKSFYQHWVHAYEEQNGQRTPNIFRPKGSQEFASSRFRMEFAFDPNGQCNYMFLSPNDAHQLLDCVYTKIGNKVYLYDSGGTSLSHLAFTIESVNAAEMRLSPLPAPAPKDSTKKKT